MPSFSVPSKPRLPLAVAFLVASVATGHGATKTKPCAATPPQPYCLSEPAACTTTSDVWTVVPSGTTTIQMYTDGTAFYEKSVVLDAGCVPFKLGEALPNQGFTTAKSGANVQFGVRMRAGGRFCDLTLGVVPPPDQPTAEAVGLTVGDVARIALPAADGRVMTVECVISQRGAISKKKIDQAATNKLKGECNEAKAALVELINEIRDAEKQENRVHFVFDEYGQRIDLPDYKRRIEDPAFEDSLKNPKVARAVNLGHRPHPIDTNDRLVVHVIGVGKLRNGVSVVFDSPSAEPAHVVLGDLTSAASPTLRGGSLGAAGARKAAKYPNIRVHSFIAGPFGDLAAPRVGFEVFTPPNPYTADDSTKLEGHKYAAAVYPLVQYEAKFAMVHSSLTDREFKNFGGRIVEVDNDSAIEGAFVVVPYVHSWDGRVIQFEPERFWDRFNPVVGIGLADPGRSWFFGGALQISRGVDVIGGINLRKGLRLHDGFAVGSAVAGEVPAFREWQTEPFIGVTVPANVFHRVFSGRVGDK